MHFLRPPTTEGCCVLSTKVRSDPCPFERRGFHPPSPYGTRVGGEGSLLPPKVAPPLAERPLVAPREVDRYAAEREGDLRGGGTRREHAREGFFKEREGYHPLLPPLLRLSPLVRSDPPLLRWEGRSDPCFAGRDEATLASLGGTERPTFGSPPRDTSFLRKPPKVLHKVSTLSSQPTLASPFGRMLLGKRQGCLPPKVRSKPLL